MAVTITKQDLEQKVQEGWKKKALAEHYGLPVAQMTKVLQQAGLRIRKFHAPKFVLVDEAVDETSENYERAIEDIPVEIQEEVIQDIQNIEEQHDVAAEVASIAEEDIIVGTVGSQEIESSIEEIHDAAAIAQLEEMEKKTEESKEVSGDTW